MHACARGTLYPFPARKLISNYRLRAVQLKNPSDTWQVCWALCSHNLHFMNLRVLRAAVGEGQLQAERGLQEGPCQAQEGKEAYCSQAQEGVQATLNSVIIQQGSALEMQLCL